ncbi:MAG: DUF6263 family protein [Myxococcota bacterium]
MLLLVAAAHAAPPAVNAVADALGEVQLSHELKPVSAGSQPRALVRYHPVPGKARTYETASGGTMSMEITGPDGSAMPMPAQKMPTTVMSVTTKVGEPKPNGFVPVRTEVGGARVDGATPDVAAMMQPQLDLMKGVSFDVLVSDQGLPVQLDVTGGDPALAQGIQSMADQMVGRMPVFPDTPIGPGASWTLEMHMAMMGMDLIVTQTQTLKSVDAHQAVIDLVMTMRAGDGKIEAPGMPPGAEASLTKLVGTDTGKMTVDLDTVVALGSIDMDMDMGMKVSAPGQGAMGMGMKMEQHTEMR